MATGSSQGSTATATRPASRAGTAGKSGTAPRSSRAAGSPISGEQAAKRDSPASPPVEPTTRRVVPPPAPGLGARQARPTSATGLKGSGGGAATASTSSSSPSAASPTAAINKALRKRLFSGIAADGAQQRQRQAHAWQRPGPVLIAGTTAKGPVSTSTFSDAESPGGHQTGTHMTTGKLEDSRAPAVVTVMQAAASNGWGLAHCLTDKQLERLMTMPLPRPGWQSILTPLAEMADS